MAVLVTIKAGHQTERARALAALVHVENALKKADAKSSAEEIVQLTTETLAAKMGLTSPQPKAKAKAKKEE